MRKHLTATLLVVAAVAASAATATADAAADRCAGARTKAAAKYAKSAFSCQAKALSKGESDPGCQDKAASRIAADFDKAEAAGGCLTIEEVVDVRADVDGGLADLETLLDPAADTQALACASAKLKSAAGHLRAYLLCHSKGALRGAPPAPSCLAKAAGKLESGFAKAERRGGCSNSGDVDAAAAIDRDTAAAVLARLSPVCGDSVTGPGQVCDGSDDDACPGLCDAECLCDFPPVCGDGVAKLPEECDDGNLADGDGCSGACALEDTSALCAGVASSAGTAIDAVLINDELTNPLYLTAPPLDPGRIFVVERAGYIRIIDLDDNTVAPAPFLDISTLTTTGGERGFLSMAFDPDYEVNGRFFVSYTNTSGDLVLARYEVDALDPGLADVSTRQELLVVAHPGAANHNGGQIQFGPDGYLYWGMGDGGSGNNGQDETTLLGKLLRLDVDHDTAPFVSVPTTNPGYVDGSDDLEYIWAKGLRNPWRFSFDRLTGDLYIGDVGASRREEVNFTPGSGTGGENYGWKIFEGTLCNQEPCPDPPTGFTMPVHDYGHLDGCAVMGGYAYRGCAMPDLAGTYFFSDLCPTFIHTFDVVGGVATNLTDRTDDARSAGANFTGLVSWGEDARGELYTISNSRIYRMQPE
jgi:cysteine-rich repeat protein